MPFDPNYEVREEHPELYFDEKTGKTVEVPGSFTVLFESTDEKEAEDWIKAHPNAMAHIVLTDFGE